MGIKGLLGFMKPLMRPASLSSYEGCRIGVDAMGWMHRGACACAIEIVKEEDTDKIVRYFLRMVLLLLSYSITPILVFDGAALPAKRGENSERTARRAAALVRAKAELAKQERCGSTLSSAGQRVAPLRAEKSAERSPSDELPYEENVDESDSHHQSSSHQLHSVCQQAISVTQPMIDEVLEALFLLKKEQLRMKQDGSLRVEVIVAPYEADAELAYLCRSSYIDAVISEDSDMLAYGCPRVLFKLDRHGGCMELDISTLADVPPSDSNTQSRGGSQRSSGHENPCHIDKGGHSLGSLRKWDYNQFLDFCILCGCDYTRDALNIKGLGCRTAYSFISGYKTARGVWFYLKGNKKYQKSLCGQQEFLDALLRARVAFLFHHVYDPRAKVLKKTWDSLTEDAKRRCSPTFPDGKLFHPETDTAFLEEVCGPTLPEARVRAVTEGRLDPATHRERPLGKIHPAIGRFVRAIVAQSMNDISLPAEGPRDASSIPAPPPKVTGHCLQFDTCPTSSPRDSTMTCPGSTPAPNHQSQRHPPSGPKASPRSYLEGLMHMLDKELPASPLGECASTSDTSEPPSPPDSPRSQSPFTNYSRRASMLTDMMKKTSAATRLGHRSKPRSTIHSADTISSAHTQLAANPFSLKLRREAEAEDALLDDETSEIPDETGVRMLVMTTCPPKTESTSSDAFAKQCRPSNKRGEGLTAFGFTRIREKKRKRGSVDVNSSSAAPTPDELVQDVSKLQ